ncbi:MAG: MCE family protein [Candidatus Cloacimonetes bacterium]|nr:MCE family protein [Candidatus Cloacimonadota bacterium]
MKETEYYPHKRATQLRVGIVTILALIILFVGYGWLRDWFNQGRYTLIQVRFLNAGNIEPGNHVTLFGVRSGRVESITMTERGVILNLLVDIDFQLPIDTKFYISDSDLMGNRQVDIIPGISPKMMPQGHIFSGQNLAGLSSLIPRIDGIISNLDQMITRIAMQDELFTNLHDTVISSKKVMESLDKFFSDNYDEIEGIVTNLNQTTSELNAIFSDEETNIRSTFQNISQGVDDLEDILQKLNNLLDNIEPLVTKLNDEDGTLHYLLTEKELYDKLLDSTAQIDSLLYDIRQNPRRYFQFRLF